MTYKTDKTYTTNQKAHGGYRTLKSYQTTTIIYDLTVEFCDRYMTYPTNKSYRTYDQMVQAARSGKQNIAAEKRNCNECYFIFQSCTNL